MAVVIMAKRFCLRNTVRLLVFLGLAAFLTGFSWLLLAQDTRPAGFRAYRLKHAEPSELVPRLERMLAEMGASPEIVLDRGTNRILIRGSENAQRLAVDLIETLDRPGASSGATSAPESPTIARGYRVRSASLDAAVTELREKFPPTTGVRVAADERTGQLVVVGPETVHRQIVALFGKANQESNAPTATRPTQAGGAARKLKHITWRELEDGLDRIWGSQLSRDANGDGELAVVSIVVEGEIQPVLQIDRRQNAVTYIGPQSLSQTWERVLGTLDRPRADDDRQTELVALDRADPAKVHRAVSLVQIAGQQERDAATRLLPGRIGERRNELVTMIFQPKADGAPADAPADAESDTAEDIEDGGLLGPVDIQLLEGLDVIVLRGHKRDVERVRQIIEDIKRVSKETQPAIEVYKLSFVGSQAIAALVVDMYDEVLSPRQGPVSVRPLVKPNSLLLIGAPDSLDVVKQLIAKLDQPANPDTQFEVFRLRNISAVDAEETIRQFFVDGLGEAQRAGQTTGNLRPGLGTRVHVVADYRSNSLIVQAGPRDMAEVRRLIAQIDRDNAASANEVRIFRLKNALATDVAPVLQDALNWQLVGNRQPYGGNRTGSFGSGAFGFGGQSDERARLRSAILTFMTIDSDGGKVLESGLLSDVRVTADANANALIITGPSKSMGLIEALVNALDVLPNAKAQIKVFTIVNGDATSLREMLEELLGQQAQTGQGTQGFSSISPFLQSNQQPAAGAGESSLVPVRFGVDQRTNSIIVTGSEGDLGVVEAVLLRLDEESYRDRKTTVYWLANSPAGDVAQAVNDWLDQREALFDEQLEASPESPAAYFNREVIVVAEPISNSIIISATPEWFEEVKHVVQSLDRKPPMIKIDVMIAAVAMDDLYELGAEFGIQDSLLFDRTYFGSTDGAGYNFNNEQLGDTGPAAGNVLGQALSNFGLGRIRTGSFSGLVLSASSDSVSVLIRALQEDGYAQVLNRPQITTMDRQPARVDVGEIVSRLRGVTNTNNAVTADVEDVSTGLLLGVTPQVTPEGLVMMELDVTRSRLSDTDSVEIPDGVGGTVDQFNIENIEASTTITTRSGQTVVFAGLLTTRRVDRVRGIPWLSTLPGVGPLFRHTQEENEREELIIVLTPHVVDTDEKIDWFRYSETERMSWCLSDVHEVYGDVGFSSRPGCWCQGECHCYASTPVIYPDENPTGDIDPAVTDASPTPVPMEADGPELTVPIQPSSHRTDPGNVEVTDQAARIPVDAPAPFQEYTRGDQQTAYPVAPAMYERPTNFGSESRTYVSRPREQVGPAHDSPGNARPHHWISDGHQTPKPMPMHR